MDTKVGCWWKNSGAGGDREALYSRKKGEWKVKEPSHCLWPSFTPSGRPRRSQALQLDERSRIASAFGLLEEANKNPLWREKKKTTHYFKLKFIYTNNISYTNLDTKKPQAQTEMR